MQCSLKLLGMTVGALLECLGLDSLSLALYYNPGLNNLPYGGVFNMTSRMEQRSQRTRHYRWVLGAVAFALLLAGGYFLALNSSKYDKQTSDSALVKTARTSGKSSPASSKSVKKKETSSASTNVKLIGLGFNLSPILYNGEDITEAMNVGRAPQNAVHDNAQFGYFKTNSVAVIGGISGSFFPHDIGYSVVNNYLDIDDKRFKLKIEGGVITKQRFKQHYSDGSTITWELSNNVYAQSTLEARLESQSSSSADGTQSDSASAAGIDTKNLNSAQLEHWVREYIKDGSQVYTASDYTFTQSFVNGYAEIYEWTVNPNTNKREINATYRVNGSGHLEVKDDNTNGQWTLASSSYQ